MKVEITKVEDNRIDITVWGQTSNRDRAKRCLGNGQYDLESLDILIEELTYYRKTRCDDDCVCKKCTKNIVIYFSISQ